MAATTTPSATGLIANQGIELFTYSTPNGFKIAILLEELKQAYGKEYTYQTIDLYQKVQKQPWFTAINPNGRIPAIVDHDKGGYAVMEGLAILNYLVKNYDPEFKFHFEDEMDAFTAEQWIAWQHGSLGPAQTQANHFYRLNPVRYPYPTQHYIGETERLYGVLNTRLENRDYVAGPGRGKYSVADIAIWALADCVAVAGIEMERWENVYKWWERIGEREAVKKGTMVPSGEVWKMGYKVYGKGWSEEQLGVERGLKEALEKARKEFGYVYSSP